MPNPRNVFEDIVNNAREGIYVLDQDGVVTYANGAICSMLGYKEEDIIGKTVFDLHDPPFHDRLRKYRAERAQGKTGCHESVYVTRDGQRVHAEVSAVPIMSEGGAFEGSYTLVHPRDSAKGLVADIALDHHFLEKLIEACPDGIIAVDRSGKIVIFNKAAEKLIGHRAENVIGKASILDVYHPAALAREVKKMLYSPRYGGVGRLEDFEVEVITKNDRKVPIRLTGAVLYNEGEEIGSVGFFHDLTPRKRLEAKLRELSITDDLTGLYNSRHFHRVLAEELARAKRYDRTLSLVAFDIDHFKSFNDTFGHMEGDTILRAVGETLRKNLRKADLAFRYGGDEFMILLPETQIENAVITAEKIRMEFSAQWPNGFSGNGAQLLAPSLSLGVGQAMPDEDLSTLLKRVDLTMYEAKKAGGNCTMEAGTHLGTPSRG